MATPRSSASSVAGRYLVREFLGMLAPILAAFVILYLIVDFFDRLDILLRSHASAGAAARYFAFKVPLILTQITPPAILAALLLSLGLLSRRNEIVALRASGISLTQMAVPLLALAAAVSVATLLWNETVVPYCTSEYEYVNNVEIRKRPQRGILSDHEIWYHGADGFYNIEQIDSRTGLLLGLTIYRADAQFDLHSIIRVAAAQWTGSGWRLRDAVEQQLDPQGDITTRAVAPDAVVMHETLRDFLEVHRDADELSYLALRRRILDLSRKGIDASGYLVDLNMKLAVPFTSLVLACVAIPLAGRARRHPSLAAIVGTGLAVGFAYWVLLALTNALGESGVLPPVVAAWAANGIYLLLGFGLFLSAD